jgi:hypothetical protein
MRICLLALAAGAVLALSAPAFAQLPPSPLATMDPGSENMSRAAYPQEDQVVPKAYQKKIAAFSYKVLEQKAEDGGKLTPEHAANLQHELNRLNQQYGVRTKLRINAG